MNGFSSCWTDCRSLNVWFRPNAMKIMRSNPADRARSRRPSSCENENSASRPFRNQIKSNEKQMRKLALASNSINSAKQAGANQVNAESKMKLAPQTQRPTQWYRKVKQKKCAGTCGMIKTQHGPLECTSQSTMQMSNRAGPGGSPDAREVEMMRPGLILAMSLKFGGGVKPRGPGRTAAMVGNRDAVNAQLEVNDRQTGQRAGGPAGRPAGE
jgi:hypothetical protein